MSLYSKQDVQKIQSTKGYNLLTRKQKNLVTFSLLFQQRHDNSQNNARQDKYRRTIKAFNSINCHISVYMLEAQKFFGYINNDDIPETFFEAKYTGSQLRSAFEINEFASSICFPSVVHVSKVPRHTGTHNSVSHTLLALDYINGELIAWEKRGWQGDFRIPSATDLHEDRPNYYWGYRKLKTE